MYRCRGGWIDRHLMTFWRDWFDWLRDGGLDWLWLKIQEQEREAENKVCYLFPLGLAQYASQTAPPKSSLI